MDYSGMQPQKCKPLLANIYAALRQVDDSDICTVLSKFDSGCTYTSSNLKDTLSSPLLKISKGRNMAFDEELLVAYHLEIFHTSFLHAFKRPAAITRLPIPKLLHLFHGNTTERPPTQAQLLCIASATSLPFIQHIIADLILRKNMGNSNHKYCLDNGADPATPNHGEPTGRATTHLYVFLERIFRLVLFLDWPHVTGGRFLNSRNWETRGRNGEKRCGRAQGRVQNIKMGAMHKRKAEKR
mmetsp:Transcript_979/g.2005  ORF Transcript_979/g.2005 Transcript_979/m.2005 type:complete len:241 (+) Transcript_979:973-1695(+)